MEIIAHRGASGYAPENTMAAFEMAVEMGAKAIELDVQLTLDGEVVVIHDFVLGRTTNGVGLVKDKTLAELKALDAGSWFGEEFEGQRIPTLQEVINLLPEDLVLHVEMKRLAVERIGLAEATYKIIERNNRIKTSLFSSFDHKCLKRVFDLHPVRGGALFDGNLFNPVGYLREHGLYNDSLNQALAYVNQDFVEEIHGEGLKCFVYTVNDLQIGKMLESFGVDGIYTNYPDRFMK